MEGTKNKYTRVPPRTCYTRARNVRTSTSHQLKRTRFDELPENNGRIGTCREREKERRNNKRSERTGNGRRRATEAENMPRREAKGWGRGGGRVHMKSKTLVLKRAALYLSLSLPLSISFSISFFRRPTDCGTFNSKQYNRRARRRSRSCVPALLCLSLSLSFFFISFFLSFSISTVFFLRPIMLLITKQSIAANVGIICACS